MSLSQPIVKQLDHIVIRINNPAPLHNLLAETFQLPVAWPIQSYPSFTSGGITCGNVNLEILSCGANSSAQRAEAHIRAIVFESEDLTETVAELERRGLEHTPALPYELQQPGGERVAHWDNVMLNGLVGHDRWLKWTIRSTHLPGYLWWANHLRGSRVERQGIDRLFSGALVFLVQYFYHHFGHDPGWSEYKSHEEKRAADLAALRASEGGALGLESVSEVVAGVRDLSGVQELWRRFLSPAEPAAEGVWRIADGPQVRLLPGSENAIQELVLKVSKLERAVEFLKSERMLGSVSEKEITVDPAKIYGLRLRLVE